MELLFVLAAAALAILALAAALGLLVFSDGAFEARLASRIPPRGLAGRRRAFALLTPKAAHTLHKLGAIAGRGSLEGASRASVRSKLVQAGFYSDHAVEALYGVRVLAALGLGLGAIMLAALFRVSGSIPMLLATMIAVSAGLFLPNLILTRIVASRRRALQIALPDAMDLMVVCLEAGGTLTAAIQRVEAEFRQLHPVLSEQFRIMLLEMQAGSSRATALHRLAERAPSDEVRSLVTLLVQSEALGASVAQTMRVFAQQTREARYIAAEHKAAELPVKMAFPLVLFIFPALSTVIFTPIIIRFVRVLFKVGQG